jgi:polysaccharide biosynthesis transport protein
LQTLSAVQSHVIEPTEGQSILAALRRRAPVIIVTTLLVGAAAAAFAFLGSKRYQSTAELLFSQTIPTELNALGLVPPTPNADKLAADNAAFVGSRRVALRAASLLGENTSVDSIQKNISVPIPKTSDVVSIVATASSRDRAATLANAYANAALQLARGDQAARTGAILTRLRAQTARLKRSDPAIPALHERIAELDALGSAGTAVPQLIQAGYPPTNSQGRPLVTVVLGVLFGLLLGLALALLREQSDARLRHPRAMSAAFDAPVLASVPNNRMLARRAPFTKLPTELSAPFFTVLAHLRYGERNPIRSVLVTSARPHQGKTTVAWNLAGAAAASGMSVALVDANLRGSTLATDYGLDPTPGVTEVLRGEASVADALQTIPASENGAPGAHGRRMAILPAGSRSLEPVMMLQSAKMTEVLRTLRHHDLVIVDAAAIIEHSDPIALLRLVDGVLIAAPLGASRGPDAQQLRVQLQALDARVIGVIATGGSKHARGYIAADRPGQTISG